MAHRPDRFPREMIVDVSDDPAALTAQTSEGMQRYRDIQYAIVSGFRPLMMDLTVPKPNAPIAVRIHGGAWMAGSNKSRPSDPVPFTELDEQMLAAGIAVASIQYRFSGEAIFPAQLHDVRAAIRWLRRAAPSLGVDASRIGMIGDSSGGHLALFAGTNVDSDDLEGEEGIADESTDVQAVVAWYPPTQLDTMQKQSSVDSVIDHDAPNSPESLLIGAEVGSSRGLARWASPFAHASKRSAATLLIHGERDVVVPFAQSVVYAERLRELAVPVEFIAVPDADHCFFGAETGPILDATVEFLVRQLKP